MYRTERISIVSALLVVGLALLIALNRGLIGTGDTTEAFLVPLMGLILVALAAAGALWVRGLALSKGGTHVAGPRIPVLGVPIEIVLPSLLAAGSVLFLQLFESGLIQTAVLLLAGAAFAGVLWAQVHSHFTGDAHFALAQTVLNVVVHLAAFLLFSVIYGMKIRSLFSATAIALVTALLLFELLSRDAAWHEAMGLLVEGRQGTLRLLALVGGLVAGELTWGLNYWAALSTLVGGAFLLVVFYVVHGIASSYVDRRLSRQVIMEFGTVGVVGLAAVLASAFLA
jgi:hypothetical protein